MISVRDIAYVRYQVPDLDTQAAFLQDFGMQLHRRTETALYMGSHSGGYPLHISQLGPRQALGVGFIAQSPDDLQRIAAEFGTPVRANDELGAGSIVSITDPDGFRVDLLHGGEDLVRPLPTRAALRLNNAQQHVRTGQTSRVPAGPSHVMRLGHVVLKTVDFQAMMDFYQGVLGLRISDSYYAGEPQNTIGAFLHCGLGERYTDHHTVALINIGSQARDFDHSAFEVLDWDDLVRGNQHLASQGHKHSWGIGRHVQGSQVFDYWRDPFGNKIEHWTDGDLVNDATPTTHEPFSPDALAQWAPPLTPDFLD
ncbi:VOC family protein [Pseudomonas sp. JH-2]|uniref:VOC family protein n=1 Tax=Pseudomonas sp. JH-2 TaxID=3114998 RepID=UPI002E2748F6|nr:VOC family protein [Pseudomonas sp. JH-2]